MENFNILEYTRTRGEGGELGARRGLRLRLAGARRPVAGAAPAPRAHHAPTIMPRWGERSNMYWYYA